MTKHSTIEDKTAFVYGESFSRYSRVQFQEFMRPLEIRLKANGISLDSFRDRRCLDAGCGGGRASILMAGAGAAEVTSYDLAEQNVATVTGRAAEWGLANIRPVRGSLLELPFADESFDVVWCNGVLHHTTDPDRALCEVTRVLKVGGRLWLYLYGSGGLYWFMVDFFRSWLADVEPAHTLLTLSILGVTADRAAEFLDDWHVPMLKRYTHEDVARRLAELGFADPRRLMAGTTYDTSARLKNRGERPYMGGGDLRYWTEKTSRPGPVNRHILPDVESKGSAFDDADEVIEFDGDFQSLRTRTAELTGPFPSLDITARIAAAARIQTWLRDAYSRPAPFDAAAFREVIGRQPAAAPAVSPLP